MPNNPGHVLVIPNEHYENIYEIPESVLVEISLMTQKIAFAIKAVYECDGISTCRQSGRMALAHACLPPLQR